MSSSPKSTTATTKTEIPSNEMYKLIHLNKNEEPKRIIIFKGNNEPGQTLHEMFDGLAYSQIQDFNPEIIYSAQQIHKDDRIETLKYKILQSLPTPVFSY